MNTDRGDSTRARCPHQKAHSVTEVIRELVHGRQVFGVTDGGRVTVTNVKLCLSVIQIQSNEDEALPFRLSRSSGEFMVHKQTTLTFITKQNANICKHSSGTEFVHCVSVVSV